jgi:hypothetical protein
MSADLAGQALRLAARGWHVFPLRPNDKRPAIRDWQARATTDADRIRRAWAANPAVNIGVSCGASRLVVIDLDTPKPGALAPRQWQRPDIRCGGDALAALAAQHDQPLPPDTYTVRTARAGGKHLYFAAPDHPLLHNTAGRLGWLIDTRATGGHVVAAGSRVGERRYVEVLDLPVAPLPGWITTLLHDPEPQVCTGDLVDAVERRSRYAAAALRGELDRVLAAMPGTRNHTLNAAAFALGQLTAAGLLPAGMAADALAQAAAAIGLPAAEAAATIRSGMTAGARHPRGVPNRASR